MLINSTADIKEFYGTLAANTSFKTLKPFVTQAKAKHLLPFVGAELLAELEAGIVAVPNELSQVTLTGKAKDLYELLANSLAYYSVLDAMPFLNLSMGNNGIQEQNIQNHTPARQWSFFLAENAAANNADAFLDLALEYLEWFPQLANKHPANGANQPDRRSTDS